MIGVHPMNCNNRFAWLGWSIAALFAVVPLHGAAQEFRNNPNLPLPAVKVWDKLPFPSNRIVPFWWLTDKILLYDASTDSKEVHEHDLTTRADTPLDKLNEQLKRATYARLLGLPLSLDRTKFLTWIDYRMVIYTLDGTRLASSAIGTYDHGNANLWCWLGDSRSWAELCIDKSNVCTAIRLHPATGVGSKLTLPVSLSRFAQGAWPTPTADGRLLLYNMWERWFKGGDTDTGEESKTVSGQLVVFSIRSGTVQTQVKAVRLPIRGGRTDPVPAPAGDRLVWNVRSSIAHHRKESLWVSRLDGTEARKLLEVDWDSLSYDQAFKSLAWLPDAKRISFVYEGALWTMSTE
jgi:hypothetical protein